MQPRLLQKVAMEPHSSFMTRPPPSPDCRARRGRRHLHSITDPQQCMASRGSVQAALALGSSMALSLLREVCCMLVLGPVGRSVKSPALHSESLSQSVTQSKQHATATAERLAPTTSHPYLPRGFSKDFETFCGPLFCLGFARATQNRT
jgi:hypothetical protein